MPVAVQILQHLNHFGIMPQVLDGSRWRQIRQLEELKVGNLEYVQEQWTCMGISPQAWPTKNNIAIFLLDWHPKKKPPQPTKTSKQNHIKVLLGGKLVEGIFFGVASQQESYNNIPAKGFSIIFGAVFFCEWPATKTYNYKTTYIPQRHRRWRLVRRSFFFDEAFHWSGKLPSISTRVFP